MTIRNEMVRARFRELFSGYPFLDLVTELAEQFLCIRENQSPNMKAIKEYATLKFDAEFQKKHKNNVRMKRITTDTRHAKKVPPVSFKMFIKPIPFHYFFFQF